MTASKEDYLKAIYEQGGMENCVSNKQIAEKLGVAAASVSEMLARLQQDGLIEYRAYHGSRLTPAGLDACIHVVRSHRLWEVFLMRCLGYTWREAHEDAHLLEHIAPERMVDRLDAFLGFPQNCPHGAQIPPKGGTMEEAPALDTLNGLEPGRTAVVRRIAEVGKLLDYLAGSGLRVGGEVCVVARDEYEGPVTFTQDGRSITISSKAASQVYVDGNKLEV